MYESAEEGDRETPTDPEVEVEPAVRVEPDAAVVSLHARVPPDARREAPVPLRPLATARALGGRLRRLLGGRGRRSRARGRE
ncbi:hypothetical protein [Halobaculum marinum]|uniref:Uncharacterized protein n=1 Tax=Halobaculum marinum TaxID=3031996 RepID=A0ABD5WSX9_9EURY|nr:hypothetical protein [Halobaculum sp. DT55]